MSTDPFKIRFSSPRQKHPLVLPKARYDQLILNSKANQDEKSDEKARLEERRQRQEGTKALSKLVMQRKEPGSELRKRQYENDVRMSKLDMERESRIEARRNYVLDLAYKRLYEETDRVKYFKEARNFSEMLKQRDLQREAKANMKDLYYQFDKEYNLGMMRDLENHEREEVDKLEKVKKDRQKNAETWKKQMEEVQKKKQMEEWEHLRDGYVVRDAVENFIDEQAQAKFEEKEKRENYKSTLDEQISNKVALMDMYSKLDEADEKRADIFNELKREMKMKHMEVSGKIKEQKEQKRQYVASNMRNEGTALKLKEQAALEKAILQTDAKIQQDLAIKKAKQEEALKSIQEFYEKEMKAKAEREIEEKRKGFQERRKILEQTDDRGQAEDLKTEARKKSEKETQHVQLHQMAKRQMDKQEEKMNDRKDYLNHIRSLNDEEEVFQKYAQMEINDCEARGLNTKPMRVAGRPGIESGKGPLYEHRGSIRPRYYSAMEGGDELNHVKRIQKGIDSKSRLGFLLH